MSVQFGTWAAGLTAGSTLAGTEILVGVQGGSDRRFTPTQISTYTVGVLLAATDGSPTTGDKLLAERAGAARRLGLDDVAVHGWEIAATADPAVSGDLILANRGGALQAIDVDVLADYVLDGMQGNALNISGLNTATLADSDQYLVVQGSTAKKTTYTAMAGRVHAGIRTYTTGLDAITTLAAADTLYAVQSGTAKKLTAAKMAEYIAGAVNVEDLGWDMAALDPALAGDAFLVRRGTDTRKMDVDVLGTYVMDGAQAGVLDLSGLASATLAGGDLILVCQTTTPKTVTLDGLKTNLYGGFTGYVNGLDAVVTTSGSDRFYCLQGGVPKYVTPEELATYFIDQAGDVVGPLMATQEGYVPQWGSDSHNLTAGLLLQQTVRTAGAGATHSALATELAVREAVQDAPRINALADLGEAIVDGDLIVVDNGAAGDNRYATFTRVWAWVTHKLQSLGNKLDPVDGDKFTIRDSEGADGLISVTLANVSEKIQGDVKGAIQGAAGKATPVDADAILILDSADADKYKQLTTEDLWDNKYLASAKAIRLDEFAETEDNTDLDASASAHGLLPKLSDDARTFLNGEGGWTRPVTMEATPVAADGADHTDAVALSQNGVVLISSDSADKGVKLPTGVAGDIMHVINTSATAAKLYPATDGTINGAAANANVTVPASKGNLCFCTGADTWTVFDMAALSS